MGSFTDRLNVPLDNNHILYHLKVERDCKLKLFLPLVKYCWSRRVPNCLIVIMRRLCVCACLCMCLSDRFMLPILGSGDFCFRKIFSSVKWWIILLLILPCYGVNDILCICNKIIIYRFIWCFKIPFSFKKKHFPRSCSFIGAKNCNGINSSYSIIQLLLFLRSIQIFSFPKNTQSPAFKKVYC